MNYDRSPTPINTLIAFLAGAALGGVVVALTTPKRGAELRKDLNRLGGKDKDRMGDWAETASETMEGIATPAKERTGNKAKAEGVADKGQGTWKEVKKGTANAGNDIKDDLTAAAKELGT